MSEDITKRAEELIAKAAKYGSLESDEVAEVLRRLVHDIRNEQQRVLAFQCAYLDETHGDRDPRTVTPSDVSQLREAFREQGEAIRDLVPVVEAVVRHRDELDHGDDDACLAAGAALDVAVDVLRAKRG